jgi:hypothetical protein
MRILMAFMSAVTLVLLAGCSSTKPPTISIGDAGVTGPGEFDGIERFGVLERPPTRLPDELRPPQ